MASITAEELKARICEILDYGSVILPGHVKKRMHERGYHMSDVRCILKNGDITTFSNEGNEKYHCEIHGEDLDGHKGAVITIVTKNTKLVILTVLGGL